MEIRGFRGKRVLANEHKVILNANIREIGDPVKKLYQHVLTIKVRVVLRVDSQTLQTSVRITDCSK